MRVRRPRFEDESTGASIDISPLIDVIFILLLFFIVTSSFSEIRALSVDVPSAKNSDKPNENALEISILASGEVVCRGEAISIEELKSGVSPEEKIILCPDANASAGRLVEVMDALKGSGVSDIYIGAKR